MVQQPSARPSFGGLLAGVAAGLFWGLAFLIPVLLPGWSAVAVTTGRYLACGAVSVVALAARPQVRRLVRRHWAAACVFAVTGNIGYYLLLVVAIHAVGAPVTAVIIGAIPITVALSANRARHTHRWRSLLVPAIVAGTGLVIVNAAEMTSAGSAHPALSGAAALGLLAAVAAMASWTCYGLANARFLERNPQVPPGSWSIAVGAATGAIALAALPVALAAHQFRGAADGGAGRSVVALVAGSLVLGIVVSWGGTWLWNHASVALPMVLAGMLINVETISGFGYVYAARGKWPPLVQVVGLILVLIGVLMVVRLQSRSRGLPADTGDAPSSAAQSAGRAETTTDGRRMRSITAPSADSPGSGVEPVSAKTPGRYAA